MEPNTKPIRYEARSLDWWLGRLTDTTNCWRGVHDPDRDMYPEQEAPPPVLRMLQSPQSPWYSEKDPK